MGKTGYRPAAEVFRTLQRKALRARSLLSLASRIDGELSRLSTRIDHLSWRVDAVASQFDVADELRREYQGARKSLLYAAPYERPDPLVTICIATYNRPDLLVTRALPSAIRQRHRNLQIIVVGDGCTDDTGARVADLRDSRVHFVNLPERGVYPEKREWRWMVAGTAAMNAALALAEGDFVVHVDDDDEILPERVSTLLARAQATRADVVWHPFWNENTAGGWDLNPANNFCCGSATTGSVFYHRWFARIPWDVNAFRMGEPGDWNRLRKFVNIGAEVVREPTPLLRHFRERAQKS